MQRDGYEINDDNAGRRPAASPFGEIVATDLQHFGFLQDSESVFATILAALPAGIAVLDGRHRVIACNQAFAQLANFSEDRVHTSACAAGRFLRADGSAMPVEEFPVNRIDKEQRPLQGIVVGLEKEDGSLLWTEVCAIPLSLAETRCLLIVAEIAEPKHSEDLINNLIRRLEEEKVQAQEHALTDGLTGIPNRRHFDAMLQGEMDRLQRSKSPLSLIMLDIDFFKKFNDKHGHVAGDHCLKCVASVVKECVGRTSDFVARYGGEEFAVVMPGTKTRGAQIVAERIRQAVAKLSIVLDGAGTCDQVTVSLGVVTIYPGRTEIDEKIVDLADMALYRAKSNGRNRYEVAVHDTGSDSPAEAPGGFIELSWHEGFNSGNAVIDNQHKHLFKSSSQLLSAVSSGSPQVECHALIDSLLQKTARHFQEEEKLLRLHRYPFADQHHQIHVELLAKAAGLSAKFKKGEMTIGELFNFLANDMIWQHMHVEDRKFFSYF